MAIKRAKEMGNGGTGAIVLSGLPKYLQWLGPSRSLPIKRGNPIRQGPSSSAGQPESSSCSAAAAAAVAQFFA